MNQQHLILVDDEVYAQLRGVQLVIVDDDVYGYLRDVAAEIHDGDLNAALRRLLELAPPADPKPEIGPVSSGAVQ